MDSDWSRITVWQVDFRFSSENLARIAVHLALSTITFWLTPAVYFRTISGFDVISHKRVGTRDYKEQLSKSDSKKSDNHFEVPNLYQF